MRMAFLGLGVVLILSVVPVWTFLLQNVETSRGRDRPYGRPPARIRT
jgi:hypothetical protein